MTIQEIKTIEDDLKYSLGINKFRAIDWPNDRLEYEHKLRQIAWSAPAMTKTTRSILTQF